MSDLAVLLETIKTAPLWEVLLIFGIYLAFDKLYFLPKMLRSVAKNISATLHNHGNPLGQLFNMIGISMPLNEEVITRLTELGESTHASRISIVQFHNGEKSVVGVPFLKMSMTHEMVLKGTPEEKAKGSKQASLQAIPITAYFHMVKLSTQEELSLIGDIEDIKKTACSTYYYFLENNTKSAVISPVRLYGSLAGYILIEYDKLIRRSDRKGNPISVDNFLRKVEDGTVAITAILEAASKVEN